MRKVLTMVFVFCAGALAATAGTTLAQRAQFTDVPEKAYFADAVNMLSANGILQGYDNGAFGPDDFLTRGQVAVILKRYDFQVLQPMREKIQELQKLHGIVTPSPQILCEGKYKPGETFTADDGCNTCSCGQDGNAACTEKACLPNMNKCTSTQDCSDNYVCSTEYGDCLSNCAEGEMCIQVCTGTCVQPKKEEADKTCSVAKKEVQNSMQKMYSCTTDADCTLYSQSCPFLSCGIAIRKDEMQTMQALEQQFFTACKNEPIACAGCIEPGIPVCERNVCVLRK